MSLTPDNRWKTPFCVNIFMLIVTTNAELSNRLISSALSNVLFERPKKPVPAHNTGCFTVQNSPFQVTGWYIPRTGRWMTLFSRIFASMSGKRIFVYIFLSAVSCFSVVTAIRSNTYDRKRKKSGMLSQRNIPPYNCATVSCCIAHGGRNCLTGCLPDVSPSKHHYTFRSFRLSIYCPTTSLRLSRQVRQS